MTESSGLSDKKQEGNLYFDLELKVNKCKFYRNPKNPLAVLAGNVVSIPVLSSGENSEVASKPFSATTSQLNETKDDTSAIQSRISHDQEVVVDHPDFEHIRNELQIDTRCLVHVGSSSGQIPYLMKKWASEYREKKKSTNWTEIAEYRVTFRIDVDLTSITGALEKCRSVPGAWMLRSQRGITQICDPPTIKVTMLMDQSKFYPTTLALLDGVIKDVDRKSMPSTILERNRNLTAGLIEYGERCWLHVRTNVLSLLKTLHGESMNGTGSSGGTCQENDNNSSTGWVQLARAIPVVCKVVINEDLLVRKANNKGALLLECYEIVDIQNGVSHADQIDSGGGRKINVMQSNLARADRKERHRIFAEWLVKTYGADFLSTGSGVLDVAGGNGTLGHELWKLGVSSTLLDPEPRCNVETVPFQVIDEPLLGNGSELTGEHQSSKDNDGTIKTDHKKQKIKYLVETCSMITGMHPDEATEAVIDTSLRLGKPFAILPCCVFRNLNVERKAMRKQTGSVDPFRSYSTFCHYLLRNKAPPGVLFETENLPFEGRNKVIFLKDYFLKCHEIIER